MRLEVTINMNSPIESILAFKCCNLADQNLEVIVCNRGEQVARVSNHIVLAAIDGTRKTVYLYPPETRKIGPGDLAAYYGSIDEGEWQRYQKIVLFDEQGKPHQFPIAH